jgi:hypothetical protein
MWEHWARAGMSLKSSPYQAVQVVIVAKIFVIDDRRDSNNAFRWDKVRLNLPDSSGYDPSLPWLSKIRVNDGKVAADLFIYVVDRWVRLPARTRIGKQRAR